MNTLLQDVRYAMRAIARSPFLSLAVLLALVAGIGLNAAVFSIFEGFWFRAPVEQNPSTFVQAIPSYSGWFDTEDEFHGFTVKDFDAIRARAQSLDAVAAFNGGGSVKLGTDAAESRLGLVTCNFFSAYGWQLRLGRSFAPSECSTPGAAPVVMISEALWQTRYSSDPRILGRRIPINNQPFTVVGVVSSRSPLWQRGDLWVPYTMQAQFYNGYDGFRAHPDYPWLTLVARLKSGYSKSDARAELQLILAQQDRFIPGRRTSIVVTNGSLFEDPGNHILGYVLLPLVMGPMILILLVSCTNVAMLLLSRAVSRKGEIAIRLALGADRTRVLRMLGTEGLLIAAVAGAVSVYMAYALPGAFWSFVLRQSGYHALPPDWKVFAFLAVITLLAGCITGLAPAGESLRVDLLTSLKGQEGATTARSGPRSFLIIAQMAMSFVLVAAGVLFARLQHAMTATDTGFETRQVFLVPLQVSTPPYTEKTAAAFYRAVEQRVSEVAGVRFASYASAAPFSGIEPEEIRVPGEAKGQGHETASLEVSANYFATLGLPLVRGRAFQDSDAASNSAPATAVVSHSFAEEFWPKQDPLGRVVVLPDDSRLLVVGVARDTATRGFGLPDGPRIYIPQSAQSPSGMLFVRFYGDARSLSPVITRTIRDLDSAQAVFPQTLLSMMEDQAQKILPLTEVILFMASLALVLALSGVYGVVAFSMRQRTREFGIRMVLGASKQDILHSVLTAGARQIATGLCGGLLLAFPAAFAFWDLLRSPTVFGWSTYAISAAVLAASALCAYYIPARRAMKVDPIVALRHE